MARWMVIVTLWWPLTTSGEGRVFFRNEVIEKLSERSRERKLISEK